MLEIVGAGWGRTGTTSTMRALELLGYRCHHMEAVEGTPGQDTLFEDATRDPGFDWERIYAGYTATVDWPGCAFWRELSAVYPQAKVLLNVRDVEGWYASWQATIYRSLVDDSNSDRSASWRSMVQRVIVERSLGGEIERSSHVKNAFAEHVVEVSAVIPASRLLVFDVRQGWAPLCDFLEKDVPDLPFPYTNTRNEW